MGKYMYLAGMNFDLRNSKKAKRLFEKNIELLNIINFFQLSR